MLACDNGACVFSEVEEDCLGADNEERDDEDEGEVDPTEQEVKDDDLGATACRG